MEKVFTKLMAEGQLMIGDQLVIFGKSGSDSQVINVENIIEVNGREEVIINKERNRYFITHLYLIDSSWASEIFIITHNQSLTT